VPPISNLVAFAAAAFVLVIVPGPSVLFVISRGVALGRRAALTTVVGNATGFLVDVAVVAIGLGAVLLRSAAAFGLLKVAGACYLVYLGVRTIRGRRRLALIVDAATTPRRQRRIFAEGFVVGVSNPKTIVFLAAILPQFVSPDHGSAGLQMLVLGGVFTTIALTCDSVWAVAAGTVRRRLVASPRQLERLGIGSGLVMMALGARLAIAGRPD
jgi:threonine/homoserine/homoserine lactone efflux protein